jgi:hypothetical protein
MDQTKQTREAGMTDAELQHEREVQAARARLAAATFEDRTALPKDTTPQWVRDLQSGPKAGDRTGHTAEKIAADTLDATKTATAPYINATTPSPVDPREANAITAKATVAKAIADKAAADAAAKMAANGGGGGGGGSGSGGESSYEKALNDALKASEKKAKQDKWLAIAQMGLSLMSSAQPNIGMALGEAGSKGIEAVQNARDTSESEKLKLQQGLYQLQASRAAAAAAAARANAPAKVRPLDIGAVSMYDADIKRVSDMLADTSIGGQAKLDLDTQLKNLMAQKSAIAAAYQQQHGYTPGAPVPMVTENPADAIDATQ